MRNPGCYMPLEDWPGDLPEPRGRTMLLNEYENVPVYSTIPSKHELGNRHFCSMAFYAIFSVTRPGQLLLYWILRW